MPSQLPQFVQDMTLSEKATIGNIMFSVVLSGGRVAPTGSRIIGHHNPSESDFDFIIEAPRIYDLSDWFNNEATGWVDTVGSYSGVSDMVASLRKGRLNVILLPSVATFNKWLQATDLCVTLGVQTKQERVVIFDYVLTESREGLINVIQSLRPAYGRVDGDPEIPFPTPVNRRSGYNLSPYRTGATPAGDF